jgi:hypothetical protein
MPPKFILPDVSIATEQEIQLKDVTPAMIHKLRRTTRKLSAPRQTTLIHFCTYIELRTFKKHGHISSQLYPFPFVPLLLLAFYAT